MILLLESSDYKGVRDVLSDSFDEDKLPTNVQIDQLCAADTHLVGMGYAWDWGDTEVRSMLCEAWSKFSGFKSWEDEEN